MAIIYFFDIFLLQIRKRTVIDHWQKSLAKTHLYQWWNDDEVWSQYFSIYSLLWNPGTYGWPLW